MTTIREPAVAGLFYPREAGALRLQIQAQLAEAEGRSPIAGAQRVHALIVPHAGYIYSGPVAASGYALLRAHRDAFRRVVLLGPAHRVGFRGLALPESARFATPLGPVRIDETARVLLADLPQVRVLERAHALEHSLEVHLPFLQEVLGDVAVVPLVVGEATPEEVGAVLERLWTPDTFLVASSDLSHYRDYATAQRLDRATSRAIEALRPEDIGYEDACGRNPINGLLWFAKRKGWSAHLLDLRNSGDTAGTHDSVVGYGAYALG
jgi:AmmeMemoRadiSam system protein B